MRKRTFCMVVPVFYALAAILPAEPPAKNRLPITISKETTYITELLRPDGYPDYVAALNQMASEGVTPENNAAVLLIEVFGPDVLKCNNDTQYSNKDRDRFFKMLGVAQLPEQGNYFVGYESFAKRRAPDALKDRDAAGGWRFPPSSEELERAGKRPWSDKECPLVAGWLAENEKPLAIIVEASHRPRFYAPILLRDQWRVGLPSYQFCSLQKHEAVGALKVRAMLRLHEGNVRQAQADLLACHRLGRLIAQGPTVGDCLTGNTIECIALYYDCQLAHYGKLTLQEARNYWAEVSKLPPLPSSLAKLDVSERFEYLDSVCTTISGRAKARDVFADRRFVMNIRVALNEDGDVDSSYRVIPNRKLAKLIAGGKVDWNRVLRLGNKHFDQIAAAASKPTWDERIKALDAMQYQLKQLMKKSQRFRSRKTSDGTKEEADKPDLTQLVSANCLVSFSGWNPKSLLISDRRLAIKSQLTEIVLALGAYHTKNGLYPERLRVLVPEHLPNIPTDPFGSGPFRYRKKLNSFSLYSVGRNGKDDMGPMYGVPDDDRPTNSDDIGVRVPDRSE